MALPLSEADMAEPRWYLEVYLQFPGTVDHTRAEGIQAWLNDWGKAIFDTAFGTDGEHYMILENLDSRTGAESFHLNVSENQKHSPTRSDSIGSIFSGSELAGSHPSARPAATSRPGS